MLTPSHSKKLRSILIFLIMCGSILWSVSWYYYFYKDINILNLIFGNNNDWENYNYLFNIESDYSLEINWDITESWSLDLTDWEFVVKNDWLQERLKIWRLTASYWDEQESIKNLDIVSDNQKVYYFLEEWFTKILENMSLENRTEIEKTFTDKKYVMIDNSKPIIKILWSLAENDLIKEIAIWLATSNPQGYIEQNGLDEKIKEYTTSDNFINYLFKDWVYDETTKKTPLLINDQICNDYSPILERILNELWNSYPVGSFIDWETVEWCKNSISQINQFLPMIMQLYKEWDVETWNFKLIISQGNMVDININYKNHIIESWYSNVTVPDNMMTIKVNWDKNWILSSTFKINYEVDNSYEKIKISWEILDWNWKIEISFSDDDVIFEWFINFAEYKLSEYNLNWGWEDFWEKIELNANWNLESWKIDFLVSSDKKELYKIKFDYTNNEFNLDADLEDLILKSEYKKWIFNFDMQVVDWYDDTNIQYNYNNWIISWIAKSRGLDATLKWEIKSIKEYNIEIEEKNMNMVLVLNWIKKSMTEVYHSISFWMMWNNIFKGFLNLKSSIEDGFTVLNAKADIEFPTQKIKATYNLKMSSKEWKAEYKIPTEYIEIDTNLLEVSALPNVYLLANFNHGYALVWWITAIWVWATIGFISLQEYSNNALYHNGWLWSINNLTESVALMWINYWGWNNQYNIDAKNSKRMSDVWNIQSIMSLKQVERVPISSFVIMDEKYEWENIYVWWNKLVLWENLFVWTPAYTVLNIQKEDFLDPDGNEYIIWVTTENWWMYQILSFMESEDWTKTPRLSWTYSPKKRKITKITKTGQNTLDIPESMANYYKAWNKTNIWNITKVSRDWVTLTLDKEIDNTEKIIFNLYSDSKWLITNDWIIVENKLN